VDSRPVFYRLTLAKVIVRIHGESTSGEVQKVWLPRPPSPEDESQPSYEDSGEIPQEQRGYDANSTNTVASFLESFFPLFPS